MYVCVLTQMNYVRYGAGEIGKHVPSTSTREAVTAAGIEDEK